MAACPVVSASPSLLRRKAIVVSQRRIDANRRNAARSTGPRTNAGKSRVARNAVRHGFFAQPSRWTPQHHREFRETYEALRDDIRPQGVGEESCVWMLAHEYARMAALLRYESEAALEYHQRCEREFDARIASAKPADAAQLRARRERMLKAGLWGPTLPGPRALNGIARCTGSINSALRRAATDLQGLQSFRRGNGPQTARGSVKVRKQTHLIEKHRAFSLLDIAAKAHRDLLNTARAATSSSSVRRTAPKLSNAPIAAAESVKTNPLSSTFTGNRHARRRAMALARRGK